MVFAELLGGMINRGGEKFREAELRRHALEDWQRQNDLQFRTNFIRENWGNMTPEQQASQLNAIEPLMGMKKGGLQALVQPAQAIHAVIHPQYAPPDLGEARTGVVTATPSTEAPTTIAGGKLAGQSIAAPASIQIGQIPTPTETATPSIFAQRPGYIASSPKLQMTPNEILAQRQMDQTQLLNQQKVTDIMNSTMSDADKAEAIKALYIPSAVLAAQNRQVSGPSNIGLNSIEMTSPDGKQKILVQPTRGGGYIDSSTGRPVDPKAVAGWTKVYHQPVQLVPNQSGSMDVVNKEELGRRMAQGGTIAGTVPDVSVAETKTPLVDVNTGLVAGQWGSRTGLQGMQGQGAPVASGANPAAPAPQLGKVARPLAEVKEMATLDKDEEFVRNFGAMFNPDFVGPVQARWDTLMANSPEFARKIFGYTGSEKLADFRVASAKLLNTVIKFITGAQMGEKEAERIKKEVPTPEMQPNDWKAAYAQTLDSIQMMKDRMIEMGRWPTTLPQTNPNRPAPAAGRGRAAKTATGGGGGGASAAPKVGDLKEFPNGAIGKWDGKGWKKVQ